LSPEVECIQGDVRNAQDLRRALEDVSFVFHFAAQTGVGQSMYDVADYVDTNVTGTANLIETIVKNQLPVKRLILSSSRAVYGEGTHECPHCGVVYPPPRRREDLEAGRFEVFCPNCGRKTTSIPTAEDRPLNPVSVYGWTKKLQEELCQYAARTFGVEAVILRYFNVYGSRQSLRNPYTGIVSIFYARMKAGKAIRIYEHGIPLRDFVHVSDVVRANIKALTSELPTGVALNVGAGRDSSILDVARALAQAAGRELRLEDHGEFRIGDIHACSADLARARELLDYSPQISLGDGMREFAAWAEGEHPEDLYQAMVDELASYGLLGRAKSQAAS
jgi:dTDP-L-rhamnose 4-epimerase